MPTNPRDARLAGWRSGQGGQQESLFESERQPAQEGIRSFEDLPTTGGRARTQQDVRNRLQQDFGVSMRGMKKNARNYMESAMDRSRREGLGEPAGMDWYPQAHQQSMEASRSWPDVGGGRPSAEGVAGAVAATSPRTPWETPSGKLRNLEAATGVAHQQAGESTQGIGGTVGHRRRKAEESLETGSIEPLHGTKERAFGATISDPNVPHHATIDTHMVQGLTGLDTQTGEYALNQVGTYEFMDKAVQDVASEYGVMPQEAQAVMWTEKKAQDDAHARAKREHERSSRKKTPERGEHTPMLDTEGGIHPLAAAERPRKF